LLWLAIDQRRSIQLIVHQYWWLRVPQESRRRLCRTARKIRLLHESASSPGRDGRDERDGIVSRMSGARREIHDESPMTATTGVLRMDRDALSH